jgi:hypothetical protein
MESLFLALRRRSEAAMVPAGAPNPTPKRVDDATRQE